MAGPRQVKTKASGKDAKLKGARILVVEARYYDGIADTLLAGVKRALDLLMQHGKAVWVLPPVGAKQFLCHTGYEIGRRAFDLV